MSSALSAFLITGDDVFLEQTEIEKILEGSSGFSVDEFTGADGIDRVIEALGTVAMFDDRRVVILRSADDLTAEDQRRLIEYLATPQPDTLLIVTAKKPSAKLVSAVKSAGRVISAGRGKRTDVITWVRAEAAKRGLKLTGDAAVKLVESVGEERLGLANALEELSLMSGGGSISPAKVAAQFKSTADTKVYTFVDAVAGGRAGDAVDLLHRLIRQGEAPQMLFWALARHFRQMLVASEASAGAVASALGMPEWRAEKLVRQARGTGRDAIVRAYLRLADADHKMKKSEEPDELTLERAVVAIASGVTA